MQNKIWYGIRVGFLALFTLPGIAGAPLLSMTPITPIPDTIPNNGTTVAVIYNITNNTNNPSLMQFSMTPIPGVEQITNTTGACNGGATSSCLLYLIFHGNQTPPTINGGL